MAIRVRDGTTAQVWSHAASWSADTAPVSTDTAIIPSTDGLADITGESQAAVDLAKLFTAPGCRVNIGSSGTPLIIGASLFSLHGLGAAYIQNDSAGAEVIIINSPNMDTALILTGTTVSRINMARGGATINPSGGVTEMILGSVAALRTSNNLTIGAAAAIAELTMLGGRATCLGTVGGLYLGAGTFSDYGAGGGSIIQTGGVFKAFTTNTAWTISSSYLIAGLCDLRGIEVPVTIDEIFIGPNAEFKYDPAIVTITDKYDLREEFRLSAA